MVIKIRRVITAVWVVLSRSGLREFSGMITFRVLIGMVVSQVYTFIRLSICVFIICTFHCMYIYLNKIKKKLWRSLNWLNSSPVFIGNQKELRVLRQSWKKYRRTNITSLGNDAVPEDRALLFFSFCSVYSCLTFVTHSNCLGCSWGLG